MSPERRVAIARDASRALGAADAAALLVLCRADVVLRVAGEHPLSGTYRGAEAVRGYLRAVAEASPGVRGVTSTSVIDDEDIVLVEGTAFHGEEPYVRSVLHRLRLVDGLVVELEELPGDQGAEDRYWRRRIPSQRSAPTPADA